MSVRGWIWSAVVGVFLPAAVQAGIGEWKNFTSMKDVRAVASEGGLIWSATSGGLFSWQRASGTYRLFTNAEGLRSVDLTAIGIDGRGDVWSGTSTGVIHVYDPSQNSWRYITDIATANQTNKQINAFAITGDTVLICTDFGLSFFDRERFEFGDTYTRFGDLPATVRVAVNAAIIHDGNIWAALSTTSGTYRIATARLDNPNLLPPESWTLQPIGSGLVPIRSIGVFQGAVYAGTDEGLFRFENPAWAPVISGTSIVGFASSSTALIAGTAAREILSVDPQNTVTPLGIVPFSPTSLTLDSSARPVVGSLGGGVLTLDNQTWTANLPNGPNANQFLNIAVDERGVVWCASGRDNGKGIYRFDGTEWKSFTQSNSGLPTDNYYRASIACDGSAWLSSWGRGIVEIPSGVDSILPDRIYGRNVGMIGIPVDTTFIVTSSVACDESGNTWLSVLDAFDRNIFAVRKANDTWMTFPALLNGTRLTQLNERDVDRSLAFDAFGNLWAAVTIGAFKGVAVFNTRGAIDSVAFASISTSDGLPSNEIRTIVVDRDNDVWVGTDRGIGIILDPSRPKGEGAIARYIPLNGVVVNSIGVDALNQKWVGTTEGVILLSSDGTQVLNSYTVENTNGKLIDNDVKSVAIDNITGTVYFGTVNGLASLTTAGAAPRPSFDRLAVSPNPYLIPNSVSLTVDGLVANSQLKILSIDGHLVREVRTPGGRLGFWDGRNDEGEYVPSGIYVIVAFSETGDQVQNAKVAVVRR
jgi:TSS9, PorZ, N-terminal beta-propeller domain/Two component regulator propeller